MCAIQRLLLLVLLTMVIPACAQKTELVEPDSLQPAQPVSPDPQEPEPDDPAPPQPRPNPVRSSTLWEVETSGLDAEQEAQWTQNKRLYASLGDYAGKAYISIEAGPNGNPSCLKDGTSVSIQNMSKDDAIMVTLPNVNLSAGTSVDFLLSFNPTNYNTPKYFIFEYFEDGVWKCVEEDLQTAPEDGSVRYSTYIKHFTNTGGASHGTITINFIQPFTLAKAIEGGDLKMRLRAVGDMNNGGNPLEGNNSGKVRLCRKWHMTCGVATYENIPVLDTRKILLLGNSFTLTYTSQYVLKELCRSQGHQLRIRNHTKDSQYLHDHCVLEIAQKMIQEGGYDYAFMQDQTAQHARWTLTRADSIVTNTRTLASQIRAASPLVKLILENTWSFPNLPTVCGHKYTREEEFDLDLQAGCRSVSAAVNAWMSPINEAFRQARKQGITDLFRTDDYKHPNRNGMYLKSCVNYLLLYGERFNEDVSDCFVEPGLAKRLRAIAESVVLGHLDEYRVAEGEKGIRNLRQFLWFNRIAAAGGDLSSYQNTFGEVALLTDIDMDGQNWTPIGSASDCTYNAAAPDAPFKGVFNGYNHTISNLHLPVNDPSVNTVGLFGATNASTIKNLTLKDACVQWDLSSINARSLAVGTLVGYANDTQIENVNVSASWTGSASSDASVTVAEGGIVGLMRSSTAEASSITSVQFNGSIKTDVGTLYTNTNTVNVGGILGQSVHSTKSLVLRNCTNNAVLDVKAHRGAGIVASAANCRLLSCVNNGDVKTCMSSSRPSSVGSGIFVRTGGLIAFISTTVVSDALLQDCLNTGTIASADGSGAVVGGVAGLIKYEKFVRCRNEGNVIGPAASRGLLIGTANKTDNNAETVKAVISDCYIKGSLGESAGSLQPATASNYLNQGVGITLGTAEIPTWTADNVHFIAQ